MGPLSAIHHLLNLAMPAMVVALLLVFGSKVFIRKRAAALNMPAQIAINFVVGCGILVAGLVWLEHDGKMLTYADLTLGCATTQWALLRGWR